MAKWVPLETGQPEEYDRYITFEQTLSSKTAWAGIHLQLVNVAAGELPYGYLGHHLAYMYVGDPTVNELHISGRGWRAETMRPGNILVLPAVSRFAARWHGTVKGLEVQIEPEFLSRALDQETLELIPTFTESDPLIAQLLYALMRDVREGLPRGRLYGECLGIALVAHLMRRYSAFDRGLPTPRGALPRNRLRRVLEYINDQLEQDISMAELADVVGLNPDYFSRAFKLSTRLSPYRYVLLKRIERACALLRNPAISISEITVHCGFASQSSFTTAFRRIKGVTPSAYRRRLL